MNFIIKNPWHKDGLAYDKWIKEANSRIELEDVAVNGDLNFKIGLINQDKEVVEYCLGSNDGGTDCEHLLLDWCIEYLKINPDHLMVSVDENVYTQEHLLKAKERNEFYWMYKAPEELIADR